MAPAKSSPSCPCLSNSASASLVRLSLFLAEEESEGMPRLSLLLPKEEFDSRAIFSWATNLARKRRQSSPMDSSNMRSVWARPEFLLKRIVEEEEAIVGEFFLVRGIAIKASVKEEAIMRTARQEYRTIMLVTLF